MVTFHSQVTTLFGLCVYEAAGRQRLTAAMRKWSTLLEWSCTPRAAAGSVPREVCLAPCPVGGAAVVYQRRALHVWVVDTPRDLDTASCPQPPVKYVTGIHRNLHLEELKRRSTVRGNAFSVRTARSTQLLAVTARVSKRRQGTMEAWRLEKKLQLEKALQEGTMRRKLAFKTLLQMRTKERISERPLPNYLKVEETVRVVFLVYKMVFGRLAVTRNRAKRRAREAFLLLAPYLYPGRDVLLACRLPVLYLPFRDLVLDLYRVLYRAGLVRAVPPLLRLSHHVEHADPPIPAELVLADRGPVYHKDDPEPLVQAIFANAVRRGQQYELGAALSRLYWSLLASPHRENHQVLCALARTSPYMSRMERRAMTKRLSHLACHLPLHPSARVGQAVRGGLGLFPRLVRQLLESQLPLRLLELHEPYQRLLRRWHKMPAEQRAALFAGGREILPWDPALVEGRQRQPWRRRRRRRGPEMGSKRGGRSDGSLYPTKWSTSKKLFPDGHRPDWLLPRWAQGQQEALSRQPQHAVPAGLKDNTFWDNQAEPIGEPYEREQERDWETAPSITAFDFPQFLRQSQRQLVFPPPPRDASPLAQEHRRKQLWVRMEAHLEFFAASPAAEAALTRTHKLKRQAVAEPMAGDELTEHGWRRRDTFVAPAPRARLQDERAELAALEKDALQLAASVRQLFLDETYVSGLTNELRRIGRGKAGASQMSTAHGEHSYFTSNGDIPGCLPYCSLLFSAAVQMDWFLGPVMVAQSPGGYSGTLLSGGADELVAHESRLEQS
eukprot:g62101.t1